MLKKRFGWLILALSALVLTFGLAACGDDDDDDGGEAATTTEETGGGPPNASFDLVIGDLVPLTGDLSAFGPPGRKAADLAVDQINEALGETGADITVNVEHADTQTQEQAAVQAARQLVSGGAGCLAGAWASSNTIPVGTSVAARQRVPLISPASTSAEITGLNDNGFVFRTAPSDNLQGPALADVVEEELGGTDGVISLAGRNDAYGEGLLEAFKAAWEEKGGQTQGPVLYDPEQPNFNSEASEIVSGNPAGYVIVDFPETYARMGAALARTGDFDASTLFVTDGLAAESVEKVGSPERALVGARGTRPGLPEGQEVVTAFDELFTSAPGPNRQSFDAQNFDATMLCFLAAVAAGSGEGPDIQEKLQEVSGAPGTQYTYQQLPEAIEALQQGEDIDYQGVTGPIDFDDAGDPTAATYEVFTYNDDGELEVVRTIEAENGG